MKKSSPIPTLRIRAVLPFYTKPRLQLKLVHTTKTEAQARMYNLLTDPDNDSPFLGFSSDCNNLTVVTIMSWAQVYMIS
jgi:hypothetical protein